MAKLQKILVHIDLDADNALLLQKVQQLARASGAEVELYSPCYSRTIKQAYVFDRRAEQTAEHGFMKQAEARLDRLAGQLHAQGVKVGTDVSWEHHVATGVLRKVARYQPDILVQGIAIHHRLGHLVSNQDWQLVRECPVPLLLLKGRAWAEPVQLAACVDPFHECDKPAALDAQILQLTGQLAEVFAACRWYVHSLHTLPHSVILDEHIVTDYAALQEKVRQKHRAEMDKLLQPYGVEVGSPYVQLLEGESHKTLPQFARSREIDIMVMGSVARGFIDRLLVGSTVERIADDLDCDLLVVKQPGFVGPVADI